MRPVNVDNHTVLLVHALRPPREFMSNSEVSPMQLLNSMPLLIAFRSPRERISEIGPSNITYFNKTVS